MFIDIRLKKMALDAIPDSYDLTYGHGKFVSELYRLNLASGVYGSDVQIRIVDTTVLVRGVMTDGFFKIGTMFVPQP